MSFPYGSAIPSALGMVGGSVIDQRRFARHWALVEDLAYGAISHQEIAEKYGLSLAGIEQFSST